tara:strand:- start:5723 stop:7621 length:1899 start_codon:yes stop_codon:yes gene_type:complete
MNIYTPLILCSVLSITAACSESSDSSETGYPTVASFFVETDDTSDAAAEGVISTFGSIVVDDIRYDTSSSEVLYDDDTAISTADLNVGMQVKIEGRVDPATKIGIANTIHYKEQLCGKITSVDTLEQSFEVLSQTVKYDSDTSFYGIDEDQIELELIPDLNVAVNGFIDHQGHLIASRIAKKPDSAYTEVRLEGEVTNHNSVTKTFKFGDLTIDYTNAQMHKFENGTTIEDGMFVRIKAPSPTMVSGANTLTATDVKMNLPKGNRIFEENFYQSIEGIVKTFNSDTDFEVRRTKITTDANTQVIEGSISDIAQGVRLKIKGKFDKNNQLVAEKIKIYKKSDTMLEGLIEAIDYDQGTITVQGKSFKFDQQSKIQDKSEQGSRTLFYDKDLKVGDFIKLAGYKDTSNNSKAGKIERKDKPVDWDTKKEVLLRGVATNISDSGLTLEDIAITYDSNTAFFNEFYTKLPSNTDFTTALQNQTTKVVELVAMKTAAGMIALSIGIKVKPDSGAIKKPKRFIGKLVQVSGSTTSDVIFKINDREIRLDQTSSTLNIIKAASIEKNKALSDFITDVVDDGTHLIEFLGYQDTSDGDKYFAVELNYFETPELIKKPHTERPKGRKERSSDKPRKEEPVF